MASVRRYKNDLDLLAYVDHCSAQRSVLLKLQWAGVGADGVGYCPGCGGRFPQHVDTCEIAAVLAVDIVAVADQLSVAS